MNMKNIMLIFVLSLCALQMTAQSNSESVKNSVVKNVVLLNESPWEVLMSKNGDILAKLKSKPEYLKGYEQGAKSPIRSKDINSDVQIVKVAPKPEVENTLISRDVAINNSHKEIVFKVGSALLSNKDINFLNGIAAELKNNPNTKIKLFSFGSEPSYRFYILSKRRLDAVLGYLKIKGVDIDNQIVVGSKVKGVSNKIVFSDLK